MEGFNSQLSSKRYDFHECLGTFYTNELVSLDNYLSEIHSDYTADTPESMTNLVKNMWNVNNLFLSADKGCSNIMNGDSV
jgi:hypothetical protein